MVERRIVRSLAGGRPGGEADTYVLRVLVEQVGHAPRFRVCGSDRDLTMSAVRPESESQFSWEEFSSDALASVEVIELSEDIQIPSLPTALNEFIERSSHPDYEIRELGQIIEHDPGMTMDLLKCVNSAALCGWQPVRTPTEALVRLGVSRARNYLIASGLKGATMAFESRLMNHRNFWNESLRRALFAQHAASNIGGDPELSFIGGLLQDFVLPILTNNFDTAYMEFMRDFAPKGVSLAKWEADKFGWTHAQAGALVAKKWKLPPDLLCSILLHHEMEMVVKNPRSDLFNLFPVNVAALLPDQLCQVPNGVKKLLVADSRSGVFRLDDLCKDVDSELERIAANHDAPLILTPIIQQAREAADRAAEATTS